MELDTIIEGYLYAIQWENKDNNSLDDMAISYNDPEYLLHYFNKNTEKLKYYQNPSYTPQEAAIRTRKEATEIIKELRDLATNSGNSSLDDLFEPLHTNEAFNHPRYYTDMKAKGYPDNAPWLRVYAVKCDENLYVITGYGIKLVQDMRDDKDLNFELTKLQMATDFLNSIHMIIS